MSVYGESTSGRAFTSDPHYSALRGRIVQQHTITGITDDGWVVRHTRTVLDFGRVPPPQVDPNEVIGDPALDREEPKPQSKTQQLLDRIYAALATQPMNTRQLAHATGATVDRIHGILRYHQTGLVVLAKSAWGFVYGLEGHDYPPQYTPTMQRMLAYLREHGPTSTPDLAAALEVHKSSILQAAKKHPDAVHVVDSVRAQGEASGRRAQVWDVAR